MNEDRTLKGTSQWGIACRQLRRNKLACVGVAIVLSLIFVAIFAPSIAPRSYREQELRERLLPPSREYPLGTDALGRCLFSRLVYGSRIALLVGVIVVGISAIIGVILGLVSGYYGGIIDGIIMRLVDVTLAFPLLVLAIAVAGALGPGLVNMMIALGIIAWSGYARLVRGQVLSVKENEYIEASRAVGTGSLNIIFRHILPNVISPIIVMATLTIPWAVLSAAALSFLGIGAQPPMPCWGAILSEGRGFLRQAPWVATFPGIAIMITVLGFNFFGDGLRDALDPRLKT
jgi:peptide/nickel transport system permease protein